MGDRIRVVPGRGRLEIVCQVSEVGAAGGAIVIRLQDSEGRRADWRRWPEDSIQVLRGGVCRIACRDAHAREIGEDRHYCRFHWESWRDM